MQKNTEPTKDAKGVGHQPLVSRLRDWLVLRLYGWKPCKKGDTKNLWTKSISPTCKRTGPKAYALKHLIG